LAEPEQPSFRPMLQVERFVWPDICSRLEETAAEALGRVADGVATAAAAGRKVVALCGCRRGEGATTMLLCAARRLARPGRKVVVVDADLANPRIARRMSLVPDFGWEEVLRGTQPLEEAVIECSSKPLAVLPVCNPVKGDRSSEECDARLAQDLRTLAEHYDLVLVDWGPLDDLESIDRPRQCRIGERLDAVALVHNARLTEPSRLAALRHCLAATGIAELGVIENFLRN